MEGSVDAERPRLKTANSLQHNRDEPSSKSNLLLKFENFMLPRASPPPKLCKSHQRRDLPFSWRTRQERPAELGQLGDDQQSTESFSKVDSINPPHDNIHPLNRPLYGPATTCKTAPNWINYQTPDKATTHNGISNAAMLSTTGQPKRQHKPNCLVKPIVRGTTSQFFDPAFNGINHRTPDEAIAHDGTSYAATLSTTGQLQGIVSQTPQWS